LGVGGPGREGNDGSELQGSEEDRREEGEAAAEKEMDEEGEKSLFKKVFLKWRALFHLEGRPGVPAPPLHPRVGPLGRRGARTTAPPCAARGRNPLLDGTWGTLA